MAPPSAPDFSAHLIDEGHEIRERFVAHGPIRPMCSKRQERAIEIAVGRPVDHPPTCDGSAASSWPWRRPTIYQGP